VGRRQHANVDRRGHIAANRLDLAVLQDAQQLGLRCERKIRDLIEEDRAAVRRGQAAAACLCRPGECALHVAE
jgi:hypothetical protein